MYITTFDKLVLRRSMKNFNLKNLSSDLQKQLKTFTVTNLNTSVFSDSDNLTNLFQKIFNKHAPLQPMSWREKRLSKQPCICNKIVQQLKTKTRLFRTHYRSNDSIKQQIYKKYLNELTHIAYLAKR